MSSSAHRASLLAALLVAASAIASAPAASARVALIATGGNDVALLDVGSGKVAQRLPLPGPATAVAVTRDGRVGCAAGGGALLAFDLRAPSVIGGGGTALGGGVEATTIGTATALTLPAPTVGPRALGT